jgi:hypothetical protein
MKKFAQQLSPPLPPPALGGEGMLTCKYVGYAGRHPNTYLPQLSQSWRYLSPRANMLTSFKKGGLARDFRVQVFFINQFPPGPWVSYWGPCEFLRKFAKIRIRIRRIRMFIFLLRLYIQCYILLWRIMIVHSQPAGCVKYDN